MSGTADRIKIRLVSMLPAFDSSNFRRNDGGSSVSTSLSGYGGRPSEGRASEARGDVLGQWIARHPVAALVIAVAVILVLWLVLAPWPPGVEEAIGKKRLFVNALFNGITLGGLYFLVATGFTLIFGLMRNVNLAHGSLYLFGGYMGYEATQWTGSWLFSYVVAFVCCAIVGMAMQFFIFRRMEGQDLRQTLVTLGLSIIFSDLWSGSGAAMPSRSTPPIICRGRFQHRSLRRCVPAERWCFCDILWCGWSSSPPP